VPIDPDIIGSLVKFDINIDYAKKCLEANKHNHITATYYLLLKKHLKNGGQSIADYRSPKYDSSVFLKRYPN
jgi:5'-AMP-activated protein kinase catalytic alpha subunit